MRTIQIPKRRKIQPSKRQMKTVVLDDGGRSVERGSDSIGEGQPIYRIDGCFIYKQIA